MDYLSIGGYHFFAEDVGVGKVIFSTAENDFNVYKNTETGKSNLEKIKKLFEIDDVGFLNQYHSDKVNIFNGSIEHGDAIITNKKRTAVGVFTADCVPVLIFDIDKKVIAAVHSGWRGTYSQIVKNTIEKMIKEYGSSKDSFKIFIGPHIRDCCYEVGAEVVNKFNNDETYNYEKIFTDSKLSMEECIIEQLKSINIDENNIKSLGYCTYCSIKPKFYSYRRGETDKRLFSFVYIK